MYIVFLAAAYLYINKTLKTSQIKIEPKEVKTGVDIKPAKVTLNILDVPGGGTFTEDMRNTDTVLDLMRKLYERGLLHYERTAYTYGIEITEVNSTIPGQKEKWAVYIYDLLTKTKTGIDPGDTKLVDGGIYYLELVVR